MSGWRMFWRILLAAALAASAVSCRSRSADSGKTILTYTRWGDPAEVESTRELIAQFQAENPDIVVRVDVVSWQQYWQKMKTATVTGSAQDVWLMSPSYVEQYASAGHLMDLMSFIQAEEDFKESDYFPHAFDCFCYTGQGDQMRPATFGQGKLYAFTRDYNTAALFYNRDHFDAIGLAYPTADWTWDDLVAAAKKLTLDFDGDGIIDQWGYGGLNYDSFSRLIGGLPMDVENRRSTFSSELWLKGMNFCRDLIFKYKVHSPLVSQIDETESFTTGKISMTVAGVWNIRSYNRAEFKWDIAPVPVDMPGRQRWAMGSGMGHSIYARTKHPQEAWRLVRFLSGKEGQAALARSGTSVPVLKSAALSDDFLAGLDQPPKSSYHVIFDSFDGPASPQTDTKGFLEYRRIQVDTVNEIWNNTVSVEEGCRRIDEKTNAVLAEQYPGSRP